MLDSPPTVPKRVFKYVTVLLNDDPPYRSLGVPLDDSIPEETLNHSPETSTLGYDITVRRDRFPGSVGSGPQTRSRLGTKRVWGWSRLRDVSWKNDYSGAVDMLVKAPLIVCVL